jgi:hypothetical protein
VSVAPGSHHFTVFVSGPAGSASRGNYWISS